MGDNRHTTVGDAIEGAASANTYSRARQDAALVFTQPTHNTTQGDVNMSQHLESSGPDAQSHNMATLDSNEVAMAYDEANGYEDGPAWESNLKKRGPDRRANLRPHHCRGHAPSFSALSPQWAPPRDRLWQDTRDM